MLKTGSRLATLSAVVRHMAGRPIRNDRKHVLLACMPKSGSSFFASAIGEIDGFRVASVVQDYDRNEQELSELALLRFHGVNYVTQNHIRYSRAVARLSSAFNLQPVVLTRNIFDVIVSMRDHIRRVSRVWPLAYVPETLLSQNDEMIDRFIADLMVPWYLNFYFSWTLCPGALWLDYESITTDPLEAMRQVAAHIELSVDDGALERALHDVRAVPLKTRNKGISGRGRELSADVRARVDRLVSHYRAVEQLDSRFDRVFGPAE